MDLPATSQDQPADAPAEPAGTGWPSVSDYWPDDPDQQQQPPARRSPAEQPDEDGITWIGADDGPGALGGSRGRRSLFVLGCVLAAALLVVTGAVLAALVKQAHEKPVDTAAVTPPAPSGTGNTAAAQVAPPATADPSAATGAATLAPAPTSAATTPPPSRPVSATFELAGVAPAVTLHTRDLGTDLYRVTVGKGATAEPRVSAKGTVFRLALTHNGKAAQAPVDVTLNSAIRWAVRLTGGATKDVLDFGDSSLAAVELAAGASLIELTLPPASGTLPVRVSAGVSELRVATAKNDPIRLDLRAGAGKVALDGRTRNGVGRGTVLTTSGWADATNRVDLQATVGVGELTVNDD